MHQNFPRIVKEAWLENNPLRVVISNFTVKARKWNCEVFGYIFAKKRRVLARLNGAQKALADRLSDFLVCLEKQLLDEYALILLQEEEYWALKSKLNATTYGDRNTSYFHVSIVVIRNWNKITCIKDGRGDWIFEEEGVKNHIRSGFENLDTTGLDMAPLSSPISQFSCCYFIDEDQAWIGQAVNEEDVRDGLWALKPFKAPGPDGLHAGFFQQFWPDVGRYICSVVIAAFNSGVILDYLNETLITLILKC
ncbi:uncharacterized protein LOC136066659 [Quercus suber]|uniref:uncharacterized protein LOC136066659 n=1 Tax=Quercus suber TaxID=58331 RepID=UPI0032DE5B64